MKSKTSAVILAALVAVAIGYSRHHLRGAAPSQANSTLPLAFSPSGSSEAPKIQNDPTPQLPERSAVVTEEGATSAGITPETHQTITTLSAGQAVNADFVNYDLFRYEGGSLQADVVNYGNFELKGAGERVVSGSFINHGTIKVTDTTTRFEGDFVNYGAYVSDPSTNSFMDLIIGDTGYLVGGNNDIFSIRNNLISTSTQATLWNTIDAQLEFKSGPDNSHDMYVNGVDLEATAAGFANNFAWGYIRLVAGNSLTLIDGNAQAGGALYAEVFTGAVISGTTVTNITSAINIYYVQTALENSYLKGQTYTINGGGRLIPVRTYCVSTGADSDHDGICDYTDNCPFYPNPEQMDSDGDGFGDLCPLADFDGDGDVDGVDLAKLAHNYLAKNLVIDIERDGVIDWKDVNKFSREYGWKR